jgi:hypothetical protein
MPNELRNTGSEGKASANVALLDSGRVARIAIAAYYRAQRRGFAPGREIEDWLEAEREMDREDAARAASATDTTARVTSKPAVPADAAAKAKTRTPQGSSRRTTRR